MTSYTSPVRSWAVRDHQAAELASAAADLAVDATERHSCDFAADFVQPGGKPGSVSRQLWHCTCGRTFRTPNGRGLHIAATERQRDQVWTTAWDAAYAAAKAATCGDQETVAGVLRTCVRGTGHDGFHQSRVGTLDDNAGAALYVWTAR